MAAVFMTRTFLRCEDQAGAAASTRTAGRERTAERIARVAAVPPAASGSHPGTVWFAGVVAGIACGLASPARADVIGEHPGTEREKTIYRSWAADDAWNPTGQSDNYPFNVSAAATTNHGVPHSDLVAKSPDGSITVRASTALAGAISQITYRGEELIHTTVGAAVQYHIRYSDTGSMTQDDARGSRFLIDECHNPTQAGNSRDAASLPFQGPSSSYLKGMAISSTDNGLQRIVVDNWPVDYTPPRSFAADSYGEPRCFNERYEWFSNINIRQWTTVGWQSPLTGEQFDNVIQIDTQVHLPLPFHDKKFFQVELVAYLRRWAWSQESFATAPAPAFIGEPWKAGVDGVVQAGLAPGGGEAGSARVFFNIDRTFGLALLSFNNKADVGKIARDTEPRPLFLAYPHQPSIYSRSVRSCGKADCPNPYTARTIQADFQFTRPGAMVSAHSYLVLGSPDEIERAITAIVAYARSAASPLVTSP
jgi:hypothetical protein